MSRPTKAEQAAKNEAIQAAKGPVSEALKKRAVILQALDQHDRDTATAIDKLIELAGVRGPFRFDPDDLVFSKTKAGTYDVHPYETKTPL